MDSIILISLIVRIISIGLSTYLTIKLVSQYKKYNLRIILILLSLTSISILSFSVQIILLVLSTEALSSNVLSIDTITGIIVAFNTILFLNQYSSSNLSPLVTSTSTLLAFNALLTNIDAVLLAFLEFNIVFGTIFSYSQPIFFAYIIILGLFMIRKLKQFGNEFQRRHYNYIQNFILVGFGGTSIIYTVIEVTFPNDFTNYSNLQKLIQLNGPIIMIFLSSIFLYFGYIRLDTPALLQPQQINRFLIINNQGLPIYSLTDEMIKDSANDQLFSGAIIAIMALLKEGGGLVGEVNSIEVGEQFLNLSTRGNYVGILFSHYPTQYLRFSLDRLMDTIQFLLKDKDQMIFENKELQELDSLVKSTLGLGF